MAQCQIQTAKGRRCRMAALKGQPQCFTHSPATARQRTVARRRGGRNTVRPAVKVGLRSIADLQAVLEQEAGEVLKLARSLRRAAVVTRMLGEGRKLIEVSSIERRLDQIEARLAAQEKWERNSR
jgi:hypothetical protein